MSTSHDTRDESIDPETIADAVNLLYEWEDAQHLSQHAIKGENVVEARRTLETELKRTGADAEVIE